MNQTKTKLNRRQRKKQLQGKYSTNAVELTDKTSTKDSSFELSSPLSASGNNLNKSDTSEENEENSARKLLKNSSYADDQNLKNAYQEMKKDVKKKEKQIIELTALLKRERVEIVRLKKTADTRLTEINEKDGKIIVLEQKVLALEWPNKVRNVIFDTEGKFVFSDLHVCKQCAQVHDEQDCPFDQKTRLYPNQPKEQRIFFRRQRWLWLLYNRLDDSEVKDLVEELEILFNQIKLKLDDELNKSEKFIASLKNTDEMKYYFSDSVARIFEDITTDLKSTGSVEAEFASIGIFKPPYDLFMAALVNNSVLIRKDGKICFNPNVPEFIPRTK